MFRIPGKTKDLETTMVMLGTEKLSKFPSRAMMRYTWSSEELMMWMKFILTESLSALQVGFRPTILRHTIITDVTPYPWNLLIKTARM